MWVSALFFFSGRGRKKGGGGGGGGTKLTKKGQHYHFSYSDILFQLFFIIIFLLWFTWEDPVNGEIPNST